MKTNRKIPFVWYATHPVDGELIMAILPPRRYRRTLIYAPRMIFERLRGKTKNPLLAMELNLGPMGNVPRHYYEEAGIYINTPLDIRLLGMYEAHRSLPGWFLSPWGGLRLERFILSKWKLFTNKSHPTNLMPDESAIDRPISPGTNSKG